ncbi:MAG: arylesterase [Verrucomicrobiales bacterium]|nr:arylesterase [Verrucomicrobiales bacterium]|tara:strand:- start:214 stop:846 length:633 start_codon:yes stop_codon:yes gene_type:complete
MNITSIALLLRIVILGGLLGVTPIIRGANIIISGDSIGAGYGIPSESAFPALLQSKIDSAKLDYKIVNASVSGDTTASGLRRVNWILKRKADVLVIELGGNDGLRGIHPEETKKNLVGIIDKARAKYPSIKILLAGMQMPANMGKRYTDQFKKIFPEVAKEKKVTLVPFLLEGVGAIPEMNLDDLIHPNPKGHARVAENVWKKLKPLLAR